MTVGDKDCCAKKSCGHGEIWHPTCCQSRPHRFIAPLIIDDKVLLVGDKFYFNFEGDKDFPNEPKGWVQCSFNGSGGISNIIVKPKGYEKFVVSRTDPARFSLSAK